MLIGGKICRYLFTWSELLINIPRSAFEQHSMSLGRCLSHKFNLRFLLSIERGLEPCLVSCYFFWLVILTSSKVHLHYKCAILTRPSSPTHLFIRIILKSSRKLVDIWNSTYGITTNHSDIKIAIENDVKRSSSVHS